MEPRAARKRRGSAVDYSLGAQQKRAAFQIPGQQPGEGGTAFAKRLAAEAAARAAARAAAPPEPEHHAVYKEEPAPAIERRVVAVGAEAGDEGDTQLQLQREMSASEKEGLVRGLHKLEADQFGAALSLIKSVDLEAEYSDSDEEVEIEIDLDVLDAGTLWKLQRFVDEDDGAAAA